MHDIIRVFSIPKFLIPGFSTCFNSTRFNTSQFNSTHLKSASFALRRIFNKIGLILLGLSALYCSNVTIAGDYIQRPEFISLLNELEAEHSYNRFDLIKLFSDVERKDSILKAISRPAEKTKTWAEYRDIFLTSSRVKKGLIFWRQHENTLAKASKEFGIPSEIIVAIIGVETRYGSNRGSYRVIDALSTLAFDYPPRAKFFRNELIEFLHLNKFAGIDTATAKGSYAGAMGYPQFIPSSYRHYAVDYDKDGKTDLINNPTDAIGSVANYFKSHGWQTDKPVTTRAKLTASANLTEFNGKLKPKFNVGDFRRKGLIADTKTDDKEPATAMKLKGKKGVEYWLGLSNFYVITRYNHSKLYAMAVYQLSEEIRLARNNASS